ncbi:hypothetical protein [Paenibacillus xylaniclasticus]|uniref:hypothetical protein n=1 Tax=Paenibacillus xylaniclasticus TaxID=588083 RepID=UPI000FD981C2|nr:MULTISPECIES: hypothetical protein [Paenibacillus]GFN31085.1 hypothetical protein PCURB6_13450 [Paenibacillus curdlanolyticus]
MRNVSEQEVRKLIGQTIYATRRDGSVVVGRLMRVEDNKIYVETVGNSGGVQTRAILPLILFDLLAIGLFTGGGWGWGGGGKCCPPYGGGYGGGPGYGPYGGGGYGPYGAGYNNYGPYGPKAGPYYGPKSGGFDY